MPFSIRKVGKNKYQVYNVATGAIKSKGTSKKNAEGQLRLLEGYYKNGPIGLEGGELGVIGKFLRGRYTDTNGGGLKGGKKWNFSNRNYNPITLGYNALLNGMTENYRNDITKEGVRQDIDRNIEQAKKFAKNPNPEAFAQDEAMSQFSRYGSGRKGGELGVIGKFLRGRYTDTNGGGLKGGSYEDDMNEISRKIFRLRFDAEAKHVETTRIRQEQAVVLGQLQENPHAVNADMLVRLYNNLDDDITRLTNGITANLDEARVLAEEAKQLRRFIDDEDFKDLIREKDRKDDEDDMNENPHEYWRNALSGNRGMEGRGQYSTTSPQYQPRRFL